VHDASVRGLSFGAPTEAEVRFAETLIIDYPSIAQLRCVSSGTEATMSAIRVARGFSNRSILVKFEGAYHGHADSLLVKAGSGLATFGSPDSAGVPADAARATLTLPFNDEQSLRELFQLRGDEIAAVIVEPVAGNMGCVPPEGGFLEAIIELCRNHGAVSIFDEVMTGSRVARGGAQQRFNLVPDLTTLGKVIGGGMPLAAYGGRADIMAVVAPVGPVYQAGTLSGNPVAVAAGLATLAELSPAVYERLEELGAALEQGLAAVVDEVGVCATVQRVGSMITIFFGQGPIRSWTTAKLCDTKLFASFHKGLLERGVYWPPSQFETAFISAAHTDTDIHRTVEAARDVLREATASESPG
jgi:glutamate-1-semialdehyde 2,1-aminomutase